MAAVAWVGTEYAERWVVYLEEVAGRLDGWRGMLSRHYPELARVHTAAELVPEARAAVAKVLVALTRRSEEFISEASRSGPLWEALRDEYAASCVAVLTVSVKLVMAVTGLIRDEASLPARGSTRDTHRLTYPQRVYLTRAETLISDRSGRFLVQSGFVFTTGQRSYHAGVSSYLSDAI
jgi:hypothetical protein